MRRVLLPHHISEDPAPAGGTIVDVEGRSMGTTWSVRLVAPAAAPARFAPDLRDGLQRQLDAVVAQMSHWDAQSDLGRYNRAPAGSWHALAPDFFAVLDFALDVMRDSGGAYDPCAGALVNAWGFGPEGRYDQPDFIAPTRERINAVRAQRAAQLVQFDRATRQLYQPGGVRLDFSAVAKGYGVDKLAACLDAQGVHHYLVEVGGELRGAGVKPDGQPWWVALEQPPSAMAAPPASSAPSASSDIAPLDDVVLALHGLSVATSGDYLRYFERDGRRLSHTIDPRSGAPAPHDLASVTVVHAHCMAADAWSTALTVLGPQAGLALAEQRGLAARFVRRGPHGFHETLSSHLRAMLESA
ncbi:FAD:protein FMN transferase [Rugamonas sp.]|uniref:FAD:protein FMN transferase n=1 Tax=Rugamonas sp. TaxID=1926287 RepID=UPI0025E91FD1|nr:FAD:protein FMN transferase [Rugamonas sp.]